MQPISHLLLTAALAVSALAMPMTEESRATDAAAAYKCYKGNGSPQAGWPATSAWLSFDALWSAQQSTLKGSCGWNSWGANNSPAEIAAIKSGVQAVAKSTGVDARFILAIVMQESEGCVRVPTTNNGVVNPGLMQSHDGAGSCAGKNPCPASEIHQMIEDGTAGTKAGPGLKQLLVTAKPHDTSKTPSQDAYIAARLYNSGSADYSDLNNGVGSTGSYANDVANRLRGWIATSPKGCTPS